MGARTGAAAIAAVVLLAAGCGGADGDEVGAPSTTVAAGGGWDCGDDCDWDGPSSAGESSADVADRALAPSSAEALAGDAPGPVEPPASTEPAPDRPAVTAGSIDDNEAWEDYLLYRQWFDALPSRPDVLDLDVGGRQVISVVDGEGRPVPGASVTVTDADDQPVARLSTYADGRTLFHAPPDELDPTTQRRPLHTITVEPPSWAGGEPVSQVLDTGSSEHTVALDVDGDLDGVRLDVALLIDGTGSMGDEIERLKANMVSMATTIAELPGTPDVRFALTVYRDHGDLFVTRTFDFTGDVAAFTEALREVEADGGGDRPEALEEGLAAVRGEPAWRGDDTIKLVFLVADAPPHVGGEGPSYLDDVLGAAGDGVKVFPIASSGLADDPQGEYVFRQLAQLTMGRFVFLTYGADGTSPGDVTEHQVAPDDYSVLPLDELVVALVADEVAALGDR